MPVLLMDRKQWERATTEGRGWPGGSGFFSRVPDVEPNSPRASDAACAYTTVLASFFHAGQGKPNVEGIVQTDNSAPSGFLVRLVAFYYS